METVRRIEHERCWGKDIFVRFPFTPINDYTFNESVCSIVHRGHIDQVLAVGAESDGRNPLIRFPQFLVENSSPTNIFFTARTYKICDMSAVGTECQRI